MRLKGPVRKSFMRRHVVLVVSLQKPASPSNDNPVLLRELYLLEIRSAHIVALLMAHLPLDGHLQLQPALDQRARRHGAKAVATDVHLGIVPHSPQTSVHCVLGHRFPRFGISGKHQVEFAGDLVDLPQYGHRFRG